MRLICTDDLSFREFYDSETPKYTMLSHTWGNEEISYKEMKKRPPGLEQKAGFKKIVEYTCCIDKRSSAELSEAINSVYAWYSKSAECLVYLADFASGENTHVTNWTEETLLHFRRSRWFTRGWTLQELIAPSTVYLFDADWKLFGSSHVGELMSHISEVTLVPSALLSIPRIAKLAQYSVAQKMSWAARRQTTRPEDIAYSLPGLFHVNMPLLYGEGEKSFMRLQEEIIKHSEDRSIFTWRDPEGDGHSYRGMLAQSPAEFIDCAAFGNIQVDSASSSIMLPYAMTNRGLQLQMHLIRLTPDVVTRLGIVIEPTLAQSAGLYLMGLWGVETRGLIFCIALKRLQPGGVQFARVMANTTIKVRKDELAEMVRNLELFFVQLQIQVVGGY